MTHIVSGVSAYDRKRWKVTLDEGAVTFLLYKGELRQAGIKAPREETGAAEFYNGYGRAMRLPVSSVKTENTENPENSGSQRKPANICFSGKDEEHKELSEEAWTRIKEDILLPRAKKRSLFYLKNGDKSEFQIRQKLKEGFYPAEIIEETMTFLKKYRLADDERYSENYVNQLKGSRSRREIEAKLYAKGIRGDAAAATLSELSGEDEYLAAEKALAKRHTGDRNKDYAYLARRGFSFDAIEHAFNALQEQFPSSAEEF